MTKWNMAAVALILGAGLTAAPVAEAGWRSRAPEGQVAVAESRYGNGQISGAVRMGRKGYEVQLPSGTWIGCRTSCAETLRVETIDFWENDGRLVGAGSVQNECGIFGCLSVGYPR